MCFIYPDQQPSLLQFIRRGGLAALVKHTPARRWLAAMKAIKETGRLAGKGRSGVWEQYVVGEVSGSCAGCRAGSLLLQRINAEADKLGLLCYLEASSDRSRSLYQRHGYTDVATLRPEARKPQAPVYFVMVRRPQQQHNEQQQHEQQQQQRN
ncbi:hypothetical protein ACK3TF_002479 [Chlorella vulgaris]